MSTYNMSKLTDDQVQSLIKMHVDTTNAIGSEMFAQILMGFDKYLLIAGKSGGLEFITSNDSILSSCFSLYAAGWVGLISASQENLMSKFQEAGAMH